MHRTGSYGDATYDRKGVAHYKHERRCMSEVEMLKKGMSRNDRGWWITKAFDTSEAKDIYRFEEEVEVYAK